MLMDASVVGRRLIEIAERTALPLSAIIASSDRGVETVYSEYMSLTTGRIFCFILDVVVLLRAREWVAVLPGELVSKIPESEYPLWVDPNRREEVP